MDTFINIGVSDDMAEELAELGDGYDEFADFLNGTDSAEEYNETLDGMGNSQPESIAERIKATQYHNIAYDILDIMKNNEYLSKDLIKEMEDSVDELWFDDEY